MGKLSKRMKRLLAILLVEVIVATNVFISYADENDEPLQFSEEELAEDYGTIDEGVAAYSDYVDEEEYVEDDSSNETSDGEEGYSEDDSSGETSNGEEEYAEGDFSNEEGDLAEEDNEPEDPAPIEDENITEESPDEEDGSEPTECICDIKCTLDSYNVNCLICIGAADADDIDSFLEDYCKGKKEEKVEPDEEEIKPEIVEVDNSVTVTAVCVVDGEEIEEAESFEIQVDDIVDVLEKAPEVEGYTFADKATIKDDGSDIIQIQKETVEEKEETEVDSKKVVTKITATTSMSYYDGSQWRDLEDDVTIAFEYTQDEETDEEENAAVKFIASFVDQDGNEIEGYTNKTLTFDDTLDLTIEPVAIENYEYVEAQIDDAVVSSVNKKTETDEEGEKIITYSYTVDGEEVEVTEDTEVTLVYEGGEEVVEAEITLVCADEEGLAIVGYEKAELPEFADELVLDDPEKAPVAIEGYEYKEAMIDGSVITSLIKEAAEEEDAESEEEVFVYSYITKDGEIVAIEEDTEITLSYEEAEVAVELDATIEDEFGDEIDEKYTNMDISKIFDNEDELTLNDPENPPVKKVSVRKSLFKTIKYTYVKASVDNEIITGLKRKAIESEDAKASDTEYAYSYTTDGETWEKIKEDTTVIFEYSDGKKTTYTYEDSFVSVTATLQHANAIPDDAEFVVTPVTSSTSGYNYDAYMDALNKNAGQIGDSKESSDKGAKKYTEDNTLLYDIAFLAEPVDEDGNAVEGSMVEYQPAEGMVKISFTFKQKQLEEDLSAEEAGDVTVIHMPLADSVKESADTTADATGISAGDINVEVVNAAISVSAEQVDFSLSDFSVAAMVADGVKKINPGPSVSAESVLGEAAYYGVVANEIKVVGHMETNFATGTLHGDAQIQANNNGGGGAGETYIGAYDGSNFQMTLNGNGGALLIHTTEAAMRKFGFNMNHLQSSTDSLDNLQFPNGVVVDYTTYSESEIKNKVSNMVNNVAAASASLQANGDSQGYEYSEVKNQNENVIDIAALGIEDTGTYYINFKEGEFPESGYTIKIKSGQNVVLNIPDASVRLGQFHLEIDGKRDTSNGYKDSFYDKVIFNCPNATSAETVGATDGTFLVPKATFANNSVAGGFLVANTISNIGGQEWHSLSKRIPVINPTSFVLNASKTVNGQAPAAEENRKFTFTLSSIAADGSETVIEQVRNNGGSVEFTKFDNIKEQGTYWYKIQETGEVEGYSIDNTIYYAKVVVSGVTNGLVTNTNAKVIYYKDSQDGQEVGAATFNNIKEEKGSIAVSKIVAGKTTDESFYFTLTGSDGNPVVNEDGSVAVYEVKAGGSVLVSGLIYDTYTLTETNSIGTPVSFESGFPYKVTYTSQNISVNSKEVQTATITNTYETTSVSGTKTWNDDENKDGKRPESITIRLWANGAEVKSETVTAGTSWSWNFANLPKYADGKEINYTVTEDPVANYVTKVDGYDVINTHESEKTEISGSKTWNDNDNQDGKRPASIKINLFANGKLKESKTVTEADHWSWTFDNLDRYAGGQEITYTITEDEVEDYSTEVSGYDVINTHAPGKTSVNGSKTWKDNGDQDGKRPASITIRLWADGKEVQNKVVTEEDGWSWNFENLDKYANGKEIVYTITEDVVKDYTTNVTGYSVINTHNTEKTFVNGSKTWNDNDDQDGIRPDSITINLYADGELYDSQTVTEGENWSWSFTNLDKYADGEEIVYTITEDKVDGYEDPVVNGYNVENTHIPEKTEVSGTKTWNDNDNQDGKRPASITINLLANGKKVDSKTVAEADGWSWTFDNLDKYADGQEITYTITEEEVEDYTTEVNGYDVINTHAPGKTSVNGSKTWNDNNNQDGKRPASITIRLYANGEEIGSKVVTEANNWSWNFENLDKYANGKEIKYTITEDAVTDYTTVVNGYNVINTHNPEKTFVNGSKTWTDADNQDGIRPTSITINLYADGVLKDSKTVTEGENWSWSFTELDKYAGGKEIDYTITEDVVKGYETVVKGYNVENTHIPEKTEVSGTKTWNDNDNQDGKRPASITINLLANNEKVDSKTITADDDWSWSFTELDKYADGQEITYTITEEEVDDYTTEINGYDVINTHAPGKTSVSGSKVWKDNGNQDGKRPESITIRLWADGQEVQNKVVTEADNWSWNFENLDKYANGKEIKYTITEDAVADYTTEVTGYSVINTHNTEKTFVSGSKTWTDADDQDGIRPTSITINLYADEVLKDSKTVTEGNNWSWSFTELDKYANGKEIEYTITEDVVKGYTADIKGYNVENTHTPEKTEVSGSKTWNDNDNQDGKRPTSITINLLANGKPAGSKVVTEADGWSWTFDNLDKYADGQEISYTITEEKVEDYTTEVNGYDVKNTHAPGKTSVNGSKTWNDNSNQDGKRPASITIRLYANGEEIGSKVVTEADGWSWTFDDLDEYANGEEIVYTISEDEVAEYTTEVNGHSVINTHNPEKTFVSGSKTWTDAENQDGIRPTSITINLYANGVLKDSKTVTEGNNWSWSFTELDKYADGEEIEYTITEDMVKGYTAEIDGYNVENTHTPEKTEVSGSKTWNDNNNQDGKRPVSITINLLANGKLADSKVVTEADGWSWTFTSLDKYANGTEINYTIVEEEVDDYSAEVDGYDVINTHAPGKTSVNGSKTWEDAGNQDGKRPTSITINLLANGNKVDSKVVTEADGWSWTFDELDKYANGTEIKYTVTEDEVEDYTAEVNGYSVINTHNPEKTFVSGSKTWYDGNNQDGKRPASIKINLFANGALKDSKVVTEKDNWEFKFENLDKYADGEVIDYTITEDAVEYYATQVNGTRVFNTYTPEKTTVEGSKTWEADENGEEAIPESIIIRLYANGTEVDHKEVTEADGWKWSFTNLDKFKDGKEITYTITEDRVLDYSTEVKGYDVINTYTPDYTQISVTKAWDDNDDQDGIRPDSIMVQLYDGLFKKGEAVELNEGNNWSYTWSNLPDSRFGLKINYSVKEVGKIDGYEAEVIDGTTTTITNVHVPETVEVSGEKTWDDYNNQDGIRPTSIIVNLLADGEVIDSVEVTEADEWKWSFTDLPKNKNVNGVVSEILYTITEEKVDGYDDAVITGFDIRNPHTPEVIEIEGTKTWDDANNRDGIRPASITVHLFANGTEVDSKTVTEADGWSWKFENLDKCKEGVEIEYTLTEDVVSGYSTTVDGFDITNSYTPGVTSRTVNKVWDDNGDRDNLRPISIRVQLYADGEAYGNAVILSEANGWSYTWSDLAEKNNGNVVVYTVSEVGTVDGYTASYSDDTFVITNTHTTRETPTPGNDTTPTPGGGNEPTPTPGENPTPGTQITPPPGNGSTPTPGDQSVLGARRGRGAVLGARRAPKTAVLGARRRPATGDTIALFIWIMVLSLSAGGAIVSSTMLKYNGKKRKR